MQHFDYQILFGVECNSKWGQTNKESLVSISHDLNFGDFGDFFKMHGEKGKKKSLRL